MNSITLAIELTEPAQMRYAGDNQKPLHNAIATFTEYETQHTIRLVRWGEETITSGIVNGRLNIVGGDKPHFELIVDQHWATDGKGLNLVHLVGRAGRDAEIKYFESGSMVSNFSLAVNRRKKDDAPDWFNLEIWGKTAQVAADYVKKGTLIEITGALKIETWNDRNTGELRSKPVVKVATLGLLSSKQDNQQASVPEVVPTATRQPVGAIASMPDIDIDDIPFAATFSGDEAIASELHRPRVGYEFRKF